MAGRVEHGWKEIGAPAVLDVVNGLGDPGATLVGVVDYVMFTGSVNTGHRIATAAAQRLIPYSLELGGKDAMIVCGPTPTSTGPSTARYLADFILPAKPAYR